MDFGFTDLDSQFVSVIITNELEKVGAPKIQLRGCHGLSDATGISIHTGMIEVMRTNDAERFC